jgi:PPOX class probable F420-dependent enzyme
MSSPADTAIEAFLTEPKNIIVAGIRKDGRPHVSPNWFYWDGEKFYVSTTRNRAKYNVFRRDPRVELVIDSPADGRYIGLSGTVEVREDIPANLDFFRGIHQKHGRPIPPDEEYIARLTGEDRVLLAITPSAPQSAWLLWGFS